MKVGDSGNVPRVTGHGACQEAGCVVNEVGDDHFHDLLREIGDWGRAWGGRLWGTSTVRPVDLGFGPVPKFGNK